MSILSFLKRKITYVVVFLIALSLAQGLYLRRINYDHIPEPYVILDEHTNVWHGLSLRNTGLPTAWSILTAYKEDSVKFGSGGGVKGFNIKIDGVLPKLFGYRSVKSPVFALTPVYLGDGPKNLPIVQPYLDHPPFGGLILSLGVTGNPSTFKDLSDHDMRRASVYIAIITQLLIAVLAYQLTKNYFVSIVSAFTYATSPSFLLLSRYAQLENVLTPLILASLILLIYASERKGDISVGKMSILIVISGVIAGLASLTKLSGWLSSALGIFLMWRWKFEKRYYYLFGIPAVLLGLTYFVWGLYLSPKLFFDLFLYQGISRSFIGAVNLLVTMVGVSILHFPFDGWWIGGFLSLLLIPKDKKLLPFYASVILILASATFLAGSNYPWYFIPLIPFLCIGIGIFFNGVATNPNVLKVLAMFFVFVSSSFYWGYGVFYASKSENSYQQPFGLYRVLFLIFIGLSVLIGFWPRLRNQRKLWYAFVIIIFVSLVLLNHNGVYYILENWSKLPSLYTPGTF